MTEKFQNYCRVAGIAEQATRRLTGRNMVLVEQWFLSQTRRYFKNVMKALEYFDWYLAKKKFAQKLLGKNYLDN